MLNEGCGIDPNLLKRLRKILRSCLQMKKNEALQNVFVDSRISGWKQGLYEADDEADRVDSSIAHLYNKFNSSDENALVLFLYVLADYNDDDTHLFNRLCTMANELRGTVNLQFQKSSPNFEATYRVSLLPPPPPDPFINQVEKLHVLAENLCAYREKGGVFILVGQPGIGKTALAAQLAEILASSFDDRVLWISLESVHSVDTVWADIIRACVGSLSDVQLVDVYTHVSKALRDYHPLLVITHTEGALDIASEILSNCGCITTVLIVSSDRDVINNDNIAVFELEPLPCDEAVDYVKTRLRIPVFKIEEYESAIRIFCERLGNLPLALKIAAGYISTHKLTPKEYIDRYLEISLKKPLQKCFTTSFMRLTKNAQLALVVMALDNGESIASKAITAGMGTQITAECVDQACLELIRYSLIDRKRPSQLRYLLHPMVRYYACEQLCDQHAEIKKRLAEYYLSYVEDHNAPADEDYDALEVEHSNLLVTMHNAYLAEQRETVRRFARVLCRSGDGYLYSRGYWGEMQARLREALHAAEIENQDQEAAIFKCDLAALFYLTGEKEAAQLEYETALAIFESEENPDVITQVGIAVARHRLGLIAQSAGNYEQAICYYQQSLMIYESLNDVANRAKLFHQLGRVAQDRKQYTEARHYYDQSLRIGQDIDDERGIADTLHQLGQLLRIKGNYVRARKYYEDCLVVAQKHNDPARIAAALGEMGRLMHDTRDYSGACHHYMKSLDIAERLCDAKITFAMRNNLTILIEDLEELASICITEGRSKQAEKFCLLMLAISQRLGDVNAEVKTLACLIESYTIQGRINESRSFWKRAEKIAKQNRLQEVIYDSSQT